VKVWKGRIVLIKEVMRLIGLGTSGDIGLSVSSTGTKLSKGYLSFLTGLPERTSLTEQVLYSLSCSFTSCSYIIRNIDRRNIGRFIYGLLLG